ncbi:hypothetical protein ACFE04_009390 [Oxalis oulophora]
MAKENSNQDKKPKECNENPPNPSLVNTAPQHQPEVITIDDDDEPDLEISLGGIYNTNKAPTEPTKTNGKGIAKPAKGPSGQFKPPIGYGLVRGLGSSFSPPHPISMAMHSSFANPALLRAIERIRVANIQKQQAEGKFMSTLPFQQNMPSPELLHNLMDSAIGSPPFVLAYNQIKAELAKMQDEMKLFEGAPNESANAATASGSAKNEKGKQLDHAGSSKKAKGKAVKVDNNWPVNNPSAGVTISVGSSQVSNDNADEKNADLTMDAIIPSSTKEKGNEVIKSAGASSLMLFRPNKKRKVFEINAQNSLRKQMPKVTAIEPNGKKTEGYLFKRTISELTIICICHGMFLTTTEFLMHAGIKDAVDVDADPMKYLSISEDKVASFLEN